MQKNTNTKDPLTHWFLNPWTPVGISGIAALVTIIFAFFIDWKLASGVLIGGTSLSGSSWLIQFYRKQLLQRDKQREKEFAAAREAREAVVVNREITIERLKFELKHVEGSHGAVINAMHRFIESTRIESRKLYDEYEKLSRKRQITKEALSKIRELGNSFLLEALEGLINIFRPLLPTVDGVPTELWAAFRQHNPTTNSYDTVARHGEYTKVREYSTETIPGNRSIPKLLRKTYNEDSAGIVVLSPDHPDYDKIDNDKYKENLSIMAGPIIIGSEMPLFVVLNSPRKNVFHDGLKPYMKCCTSFLSECIRSWSEPVEFVK